MKTTIYVDGDVLMYESAFAGQTTISFGEEEIVRCDVPRVLHNFDQRIKTLQRATNASYTIVALSSPTRRYFRHDLADSYKATRVKTAKPLGLAPLRKHIEENYYTHSIDNLEADDVLGIALTHPVGTIKKDSFRKILISTDKDLLQIPGLHLNPSKVDEGLFTVTEREGRWWHMYQTLVGDATDNYPGCPGIGPVKARQILLLGMSPEEMWAAVVATFIKKGKTEEDALVQARLARILQYPDFNLFTKEPILWTPPSLPSSPLASPTPSSPPAPAETTERAKDVSIS